MRFSILYRKGAILLLLLLLLLLFIIIIIKLHIRYFMNRSRKASCFHCRLKLCDFLPSTFQFSFPTEWYRRDYTNSNLNSILCVIFEITITQTSLYNTFSAARARETIDFRNKIQIVTKFSLVVNVVCPPQGG